MASPSAARTESAGIGIGGALRIAARVAALALLLCLVLPPHAAWRLLRLGSPWPRLFLAGAARICGARVRVVGRPMRRDVVFIANHVSWIDILAMGGASGTAFVAKAEVDDTPVVGWLARRNHTLFVRREERMQVAGQIAALAAALADGWAVTIFPEGTTGDGRTLLPFKSAMLKVLEPPPPGVMVQPVLVDYGAAAADIAWVGAEPGLDNVRRVLLRRGGFTLTLDFLPSFDPAALAGRKAIAAAARDAVAAAMDRAHRS